LVELVLGLVLAIISTCVTLHFTRCDTRLPTPVVLCILPISSIPV